MSKVLTPLIPAYVASVVEVAKITLSPSGAYAYAPSAGTADIAQYGVVNGTFNALAPPLVAVPGASAGGFVLNPANGSNAVALDSANDLWAYTVVGGALTYQSTVATGAGPREAVYSPAGTNLYVTCNNSVSQYAITAGIPVPLGVPSVAIPGTAPPSLKITPNGTYAFVWCDNGAAGVIRQYSFTAGALTALSPATVATGVTMPGGMLISANSLYAYFIDNTTPSIRQYSIGPGGLTAIGAGPLAVTNNMDYLKFSPDGNYLYAGGFGSADIAQFAITAGVLTYLGSVTVGTGMDILTFTPDSAYAFLADYNNNVVKQYGLIAGVLTPRVPASVSVGLQPSLKVLALDGGTLYVLNSGDKTISEYAVNNGLLSFLNPPLITVPGSPQYTFDMQISDDGKYMYVVDLMNARIFQYGLVEQNLPTINVTVGFAGLNQISVPGDIQAGAFVPIVSSVSGSIEPRVWMPRENVTVRYR